MSNTSILLTLAEITDFVKECLKDKDFVGINVVVSKHPGRSYVLGKTFDSLKAKYILKVQMDYTDPIQRPLIANAVHKGMYGTEMSPEEMEDEMVCKSSDD